MIPLRPFSGQNKIFKCPVHGYVSVPREIVRQFIDNKIFQRLRNIEQTSIRPLYPSAHHNRFVHSLGVYHLAQQAFRHLRISSNQTLNDASILDEYQWPFLLAALMHDCGHAPYSHALEGYYQEGDIRADDLLLTMVDEQFKADYEFMTGLFGAPAPHELFGAYLFISEFSQQYLESVSHDDGHPGLIARMITGIPHRNPNSERQQIENGLISLINGDAIDMDKLDYIIRDSWASGVKNVAIDTHRLLSAIRMVHDGTKVVTAFDKSALSVVRNIVDGRNYLYRWIMSHHTVTYFSHVFGTACDKMMDEIGDGIVDVLFAPRVFKEPVSHNDRSYYLPSDADILVLLKQFATTVPEVDEILSRTPSRIPLWKTTAEFELILKGKNDDQRHELFARAEGIIERIIGNTEAKEILKIEAKPKIISAKVKEVRIAVNGQVVNFEQAVPDAREALEPPRYLFYVYIPKTAKEKRDECIEAFKQAPTSR